MTKTVTAYEFLRFTEGERFDKDDWILAAVSGPGAKTVRVVKLTAPDLVDILKHLPEPQREQVLSGVRTDTHVGIGPKTGPWFYEMGAKDVAEKLRARCRVSHAKAVDSDALERVMPILLAARPFFMFPDSFSPTDIDDLLVQAATANSAPVEKEDQEFVQRITEMFHPDMNYPDIENAIRELIDLAEVVWRSLPRPARSSLGGRSLEELTQAIIKTRGALWCGTEVLRLYKANERVSRLGVQPTPGHGITVDEAVRKACAEPSLAKALSWVALWDTERAIRQAMRNVPSDTRTPQGGLWETSFELLFEDVLRAWAHGIPIKVSSETEAERRDGEEVLRRLGDYTWTAALEKLKDLQTTVVPAPVPMLLYCPMCHTKHIDEGEFATKVHTSHACQGFVEVEGKKRRCGHVWRPAIVPTVGVEALPGFVNEP